MRRIALFLAVLGLAGCGAASSKTAATTDPKSPAAVAGTRATSPVQGFTVVATGPAGGSLLAGVVPDARAPKPLRPGFIYLPPRLDRLARYPVVYLLHGLPGGPDEYVDALHLADVADRLISTGAVRPFIAVGPAAGPSVHYNGEWAGPWEDYLVHGVVPWVDAHLPTDATAAGRTLAGLSAGGYGAVDIGLRSPSLFGRIESWSGYFRPLRDGPFKGAGARTLAANDPTKVVRTVALQLRLLGTRFYLGSGPTHSHWFEQRQTVDFAAQLRRLGVPVTLELYPSAKGQYSFQLQAGLRWALGPAA